MAIEQTFNVDPNANSPTLEQQAAALDAAAAARAAAAPATDRPDWLPEQFKTVEDYVKSATDTRAELTRTQQKLAELEKGKEPPAEAPKTEGTQDAPQTEADKAAQAIVEQSGADISPFSEEFNSTGDVSEDSRAKLAEALGKDLEAAAKAFKTTPRALIDQYVEGAKATVANARNAAFTEAGGEEAYGQMVEWAKTGLTAEQKAAYNKAVDGPGSDINSRLLAIRGLRASFEKANGRSPTLVKGANAQPSADTQAFASVHEQTQAINDPRYKKDPDYRAKVLQRMLASNL